MTAMTLPLMMKSSLGVKIYRGVIERRVGHQHYLTVRAIVNEAFDSGSIVNDCQHDVATHHVPVLAVGDRKGKGVVVGDDAQRPLAFGQEREIVHLELRPGADSHGDGIGIAGRLVDMLVAQPSVDDRIDGSLRTNSASVDPALFMESAFGVDSSGRPFGGGRADKGGFQIPLGVLAESEDQDALWTLVEGIVRTRLAKVVPEIEREYERAHPERLSHNHEER